MLPKTIMGLGSFLVKDVRKYIVTMDHWNIPNIYRIIENDIDNKVKKPLDYTGQPKNIADLWYTEVFEQTDEGIIDGCEELLHTICEGKRR
jgi:protein-tyrosine phosphatase